MNTNYLVTKKLDHFIHVSSGEARRHFRPEVFPKANTFDDANEVMMAEFNSVARQRSVAKKLSILRVAKVCKERKQSILNALKFIREEIRKKADQGPSIRRRESSRAEYVRNSVIGLIWTKEALRRCHFVEPSWSLKQLHAALDLADLQEKVEALLVRQTKLQLKRNTLQ